jgi:hypothetical protein
VSVSLSTNFSPSLSPSLSRCNAMQCDAISLCLQQLRFPVLSCPVLSCPVLQCFSASVRVRLRVQISGLWAPPWSSPTRRLAATRSSDVKDDNNACDVILGCTSRTRHADPPSGASTRERRTFWPTLPPNFHPNTSLQRSPPPANSTPI